MVQPHSAKFKNEPHILLKRDEFAPFLNAHGNVPVGSSGKTQVKGHPTQKTSGADYTALTPLPFTRQS